MCHDIGGFFRKLVLIGWNFNNRLTCRRETHLRNREQLSANRETLRRRGYEIFPVRNHRKLAQAQNSETNSTDRQMEPLLSDESLDLTATSSGFRDSCGGEIV